MNNKKITERVSFSVLSTLKVKFFSGSGGTHGPDLPSPFWRKFFFRIVSGEMSSDPYHSPGIRTKKWLILEVGLTHSVEGRDLFFFS